MNTGTHRATAAEVRAGWIIDIPDAGAQIRVADVGVDPGGFIRIEGRPTDAVRKVAYLLSPIAQVTVQYSSNHASDY